MDLQMTGKTALVTGGSAGIGKAIALALAREGVDAAICARRKEPLEAAASQIARETNRKIVPIPANLTKPSDAEAFVKEAFHRARAHRYSGEQRGIRIRRSSRFSDRRGLGAVVAAQIHGLCALLEACVADHAESRARPRRQSDWQ